MTIDSKFYLLLTPLYTLKTLNMRYSQPSHLTYVLPYVIIITKVYQ